MDTHKQTVELLLSFKNGCNYFFLILSLSEMNLEFFKDKVIHKYEGYLQIFENTRSFPSKASVPLLALFPNIFC